MCYFLFPIPYSLFPIPQKVFTSNEGHTHHQGGLVPLAKQISRHKNAHILLHSQESIWGYRLADFELIEAINLLSVLVPQTDSKPILSEVQVWNFNLTTEFDFTQKIQTRQKRNKNSQPI